MHAFIRGSSCRLGEPFRRQLNFQLFGTGAEEVFGIGLAYLSDALEAFRISFAISSCRCSSKVLLANVEAEA